MAWAKLDDGFADHPKVIEAGPLASWLFVCGLTYCARQLTDGFIPAGQIRKLADVDNAKELAQTLVSVGLWEECDGGYMIHDYLEYNPSRERVLATREVRAEVGSRGGKAKAANAASISKEEASPESKQNASNLVDVSQTFATENLKQNPTPSRTRPVPVSPPEKIPEVENERDSAPAAPVPLPKYSPAFEVFWREYPSGHGNKVKTYAAWKAHGLDKAGSVDERNAVMAGLHAWKSCERWAVKGMVKAAETWVKERWWEDDPPPPDSVRIVTATQRHNDPQTMFDLAERYRKAGQ